MKTFFIVGLPRSRTAWLANLLTYGDCFCFHEAINRVSGTQQLPALFEQAGRTIVGDSDSGVPLMFPEIDLLFPDANYLFVHRDFNEALASTQKFLSEVSPQIILSMFEKLEACLRDMELRLPRARRMSIGFRALDSFGVLDALNRFCTGRNFTTAAARDRVRMLTTFRINIISEKVIRIMPAPKRQMAEALLQEKGN